MIHVMAATGLGGTAMSAPVVRYDAIAVIEEEQHLRVPIIGRQRPTVAKHDGLSFAPVLVVNLRPIFRRNCRHVMFSFFLMSCFRDPQTSRCLRDILMIWFSVLRCVTGEDKVASFDGPVAGKAGVVRRLVGGFPVVKLSEPQAAGRGAFS